MCLLISSVELWPLSQWGVPGDTVVVLESGQPNVLREAPGRALLLLSTLQPGEESGSALNIRLVRPPHFTDEESEASKC